MFSLLFPLVLCGVCANASPSAELKQNIVEHDEDTEEPYSLPHTTWANIQNTLVGYNLLKGNPFENLYDQGFSRAVFKPFVPNPIDKSPMLHPGITVVGTRSCKVSSNTKLITTAKSYQNLISELSKEGLELSTNPSVDIELSAGVAKAGTTVPPLLAASFTSSKSFKENEQFLTKEMGIVTVKDAICSSYTSYLDPYYMPPFSEGFKRALLHLEGKVNASESEKDQAFQLFASTYGTHYIEKAVMGARIAATVRYTANERKTISDKDMQACSTDSIKVLFFASKTSSQCKIGKKSLSKEVKTGMQRSFYSSYGSKPKRDFLEWSQQSFDVPVPIKMKLAPIVNLFQDKYMKDVEGNNVNWYGTKQPIDFKGILKFFGKRWWNYCETQKQSGAIRSCKPTQEKGCGWDDTCNRGFEVCKDLIDATGTVTGFKCECPPDKFTCTNGKCINKSYKCDGTNDCGDWSDEYGQDEPGFKCKNNKCIKKSWKCDGGNDCGDWSDEYSGYAAGYTCRSSRKCIKKKWVCDGDNDCGDWSDEHRHQCPTSRRCDGQNGGCCEKDTPCRADEGDCDFDSDCKGSLECGDDNCSWGQGDDCCRIPASSFAANQTSTK